MTTIVTITTFLMIAFFARSVFWRQQAESGATMLTNMIPHKDNVDLELATTQQIIQELFRRPNNRFMMLIPEETGHDLLVSIHSMNVTPELALTILQKTYEGIDGLAQNDDDGGEPEFS
jgi:hypothetical protein